MAKTHTRGGARLQWVESWHWRLANDHALEAHATVQPIAHGAAFVILKDAHR
jgi:hypothetical protein